MRLIAGRLDGAAVVRTTDDQSLPPDNRVSAMHSDRSAFLSAVYRDQAPRLKRLFSRQAGVQEAEDLVQDSFARLAGASNDDALTIDCPEAYLSRIAGNLLRDRAKSAFQRAQSSQVPIDELSLASPDQIAALEARDVLNCLNAAIRRLSPTTREVFMAHRLDGRSHAEIAHRIGISTASVARHMTKAIAHIHRALQAR